MGLPYKHFVRFGVIPRRNYEAELLETLQAEERPADDSGTYADRKEFTFMGLFQVDETGLPQASSLELAAFASAFACLKLKKDLSFDHYKQALSEGFDAACEEASKEARPVDRAFLTSLTDRAISELGWIPKGIEHAPTPIIRTAAVKDESGRTLNPTPNPVNGFFFEDICKVLARYRAGEATGLIANYLAEPDEGKQVDCTAENSIEQSLTLSRMPDGRWPSTHPLTLMQQVAVNQAFASLNRTGACFLLTGRPEPARRRCSWMLLPASLSKERRSCLLSTIRQRRFGNAGKFNIKGVSRPTAIFALESACMDSPSLWPAATTSPSKTLRANSRM